MYVQIPLAPNNAASLNQHQIRDLDDQTLIIQLKNVTVPLQPLINLCCFPILAEESFKLREKIHVEGPPRTHHLCR
ncbi:hypothetical protein E2C01_100040 [Portunus trituberculatus]|uniref:Uncharacterized protein n=1 Tax=Portunus trituberculatus TaxID=210409 RepID=A0A5B7KGX8_PORTR|nr:hypothetical protein [Portunus trituberculatus]